MTFGIRIVLAGIAAIAAGGLFISESFEKPLEGMEPRPIWKGALALVLGIGLVGFGIKYLIDENRDSAPAPSDDGESR